MCQWTRRPGNRFEWSQRHDKLNPSTIYILEYHAALYDTCVDLPQKLVLWSSALPFFSWLRVRLVALCKGVKSVNSPIVIGISHIILSYNCYKTHLMVYLMVVETQGPTHLQNWHPCRADPPRLAIPPLDTKCAASRFRNQVVETSPRILSSKHNRVGSATIRAKSSRR